MKIHVLRAQWKGSFSLNRCKRLFPQLQLLHLFLRHIKQPIFWNVLQAGIWFEQMSWKVNPTGPFGKPALPSVSRGDQVGQSEQKEKCQNGNVASYFVLGQIGLDASRIFFEFFELVLRDNGIDRVARGKGVKHGSYGEWIGLPFCRVGPLKGSIGEIATRAQIIIVNGILVHNFFRRLRKIGNRLNIRQIQVFGVTREERQADPFAVFRWSNAF